MSSSTKAILTDYNGKPIPQYWNQEKESYEPIISENGMLKVLMVDINGVPIQSQDLVDQINVKLEELVEVVKGGI